MLKPVFTNTFDGKKEKFEFFEDLFHTMLKLQPEMTETMKNNYFHSYLSEEALQTFGNKSSSNRRNPLGVFILFWQKYVKPGSQATAKNKWHKLTFDRKKKPLSDFLEEFNECAKSAFGDNAQHMMDNLLYAKLPPHLKRSLNLAYLESGTYDQKVAHLAKGIEVSGLENDVERSIPTMMIVSPKNNTQKTEQLLNTKPWAITLKNLAPS